MRLNGNSFQAEFQKGREVVTPRTNGSQGSPQRYQLSTDGLSHYVNAVEMLYGRDGLDYAQIEKRYATENPGSGRYSPAKITGVDIAEICGRPDRDRICTSYVERNNLTSGCRFAGLRD